MDAGRYEQLMKDEKLQLTEEEIKKGWHFCWDWDGLLVHPDSPEGECCRCRPKRVSQTIGNAI